MRLRRINNVIHRDLGYFLAGAAVLYAISGLALNHAHDWDPNFIVEKQEIAAPTVADPSEVTREWVLDVLKPLGEESNYRSHDFATREKLKVYLDEGSVFLDLAEGKGLYESVRRRPVLFRLNCLHVSPKDAWLAFADFFAVSLILVSITGLFVLKGKHGITGRGALFATAGLAVPLAFFFVAR